VPQAALYYPDWRISDPEFLFESLLYWDRLACIVPYEHASLNVTLRERSGDAELQDAVGDLNDAFVSGIAPTPEQQRAVHERLRFFLEQDPPEWCRPEKLEPETEAYFSTWKFSEDTYQLLRDHGWIRDEEHPDGDELRIRTIAGAAMNVLLGALAEECSSESLPPITSDAGSFRASCNTLLFELGASTGVGAEAAPQDSGEEDYAFALCSVARLGSSDKKVTAKDLKRLYKLRMDTGFDAQRRAFRERVDEYVDALRAAPVNERQLLVDDWKIELERDRAGLKKELRSAGFRSIVDKEGVIALVVSGVAGAVLVPVAAIGVAAMGGRTALAARKSRRDVLDQHWTSWLFSVQQPRLALR
jgi:hypothetical protein